MPTGQLQAVGVGGVIAIIIMGLTTQLAPGTIDWTAETMGVPLGSAFVFLGTLIASWIKGGS